MAAEKPIPERIITPMPRELVAQIDDFRWGRRIPSRAEAIRQLIEAGLRCGPDQPKNRAAKR